MVPTLLGDDAQAPTTPSSSDAPEDAAPHAPTLEDPPETPAGEPDGSEEAAPEDPAGQGTPQDGEGQDAPTDDGSQDEPEAVDYSGLELPDESLLTDDDLGTLREFAKANGLSIDQAKAVVGLQSASLDAALERHQEQLATWETEIREDKEIGGKSLDESIRHAKSAAADLFPPELRAELVNTGYEFHPGLFRALVRHGKRLAEPGTVVTRNDGAVPDDDDEASVVALFTHPDSVRHLQGSGAASS